MAKNPFQKAEEVKRFVKVLVFGDSGTGKTYFALNSPRPCAIIDLEGGSALYATHKNIGGFDRIATRSLREIEQAIRFCEGGDYATLVVDPITLIWQLLQEAAVESVGRRNRGKAEVELSLTPRDWGAIKRKYASLMTMLVNLPCNVVLCSRSKDLTQQDARGNLQVIGTKADAEKSTPYLPDVTIELKLRHAHNQDGSRGEVERVAIVHKDRTGTYQPWEIVHDPTLALWLQATGQGAKTERLQSEEEIAAENAAYFDEEPPSPPTQPQPTPPPQKPATGKNDPIDRYFPPIFATAKDLSESTYGRKVEKEDLYFIYQVRSLHDLTPEELGAIPTDLKKWGRADKARNAHFNLKDLEESLDACATIGEMAEAFRVWKEDVNGSLSPLAKALTHRIKEDAKLALACTDDVAGMED